MNLSHHLSGDNEYTQIITPWTPIITVYGEALVKLGDKVYTVKAPEGVTIREEHNHESIT